MIHVVDYINSDVRHMDHWRTVVPCALSEAGYDVNIVCGGKVAIASSEVNLIGEAYYKTLQFEDIFHDLRIGQMTDGDIVVFGDAWNPTAIALKYIQAIQGLDIKMIGFWRDGSYDVDSKIWRGLLRKPKQWVKSFERSLFEAYDHNCFLSHASKHRIQSRYNFQENDKIHFTGLPYECLKYTRGKYDPVPKENIVVIPHDASDPQQREIVYALGNTLTDYTFIDAVDARLSTNQYYEILNRAKVVLCVGLSETDPTNVYEAMLFGCVPVVPDGLVYKEVIPDEYRYPMICVNPPFLNFVRNHQEVHSRINDVMHNYDAYVDRLNENCNRIGGEYFSNDPLLSIIKKIGDTNESSD